jgi:hypothetical protein
MGVTWDSEKNIIYIADTLNHRIRVVTSSGIITTLVGTGVASVSSSALNGDGEISSAASLNYPTSVSLDSFGRLYIADSRNHRIRRVNTTSYIISTVAGTGDRGYNGDNIDATTAQLAFPFGIAVDQTSQQ